MKKITLLFMVLLTSFLYSQDFAVDNFNYNITSSVEPYTVEIDGFETEDRSLSSIYIPDTVTYNSIEYTVTAIADHSFRNLSYSPTYTSVSIGENVTRIGDYAFYDGDIYRFFFRGNSLLETIGDLAFSRNADNFTSFTIPSNVTTIGVSAFSSNSKLTIENFPESLTSIGQSAFYNVLTVSPLNIPEGITVIENNTFKESYAFYVTMSNDVTSIGESAFYASYVLTLQLSENLITIEEEAFRYNQLTSIEIPNSVETIGDYAFQGSSVNSNYLEKIVLGSSLTSIGEYVFGSNPLLTKVISLSTNPATLPESAFSNESDITLFIPKGTTAAYEAAGWIGFYNVVEFDIIPQVLKLSTNAEIGSITTNIAPINDVYDNGTQIELTAVPDDGYVFVEWSGDVTGTDNPITITMDGDKEVEAIFKAACIVDIPDENFRTGLLANSSITIDGVKMTIDTDGDREISCEEAEAFTGVIYTRFDNITDLTGIEAFVNIVGLNCEYNDLVNIDISNNTSLEYIHCKGNDLTSLNLANGNNTNFYHAFADEIQISSNLSNLTCIQVDDVTYSEENWSDYKDATTSFSTDCDAFLSIVDNEFSTAISVYPNPVKNTLNISLNTATELQKVEVYNMLGKKVLSTTTTHLNTSSLSSGLYLLKITSTSNKVGVKKFVKK